MQNVLRAVGPIANSNAVFGQLDLNRDGTVSGAEFSGLNGALANARAASRATAAPSTVTTNPQSTATIPGTSPSTATIPGTVTTGTVGLSASGSATLFQQFDTNGDGLLSGDEFSRMSATVNQSTTPPGNPR